MTRIDDLKREWLAPVMELVGDAMRTVTPSGSTLLEMGSYHLSTGGKRLRALLPLAVAEALDTDPARVVPFAAACEMLHNATLVHDDLQDGDETRRGAATVWAKWDAARAINLGDAMLYWTIALALRSDIASEAKVALVERIVQSAVSVIDGQEREFALMEADAPDLGAYFRMVEGKTSGLFALPIVGAAELCGAAPAELEGLEDGARHLGVLFQMQDDILDLYGDKGRGERGSDIGEGKISALVAHFLERGPRAEARELREILRRERAEVTSGDVERVTQWFRSHGSLSWALAEIERRRRVVLDDARPRASLRSLLAETAALFLRPIEEVA